MYHNSTSSHAHGNGKHSLNITHSDPNLAATMSASSDIDFYSNRNSSFSTVGGFDDASRFSAGGSPMMMSPWNSNISPWLPSIPATSPAPSAKRRGPRSTLIGSLVREEGHVYSLATRAGDLLYTGSDSKNIRVWKDLKEFSGFKSASGLVKAIVISGDKIFTGHQDGKIRVWKTSVKHPTAHKRSGSLPTLKDIFKASIKPSNYVEVKRNKSVLWIKHSDAISCMSLDAEHGILYSASWDRTFKVWRIADSKCLESVSSHTDAVNSVATASRGLVFTGSADGTVKAWKREEKGKGKRSGTKHALVRTLLKQETAVTALAVDPTREVLYCGSSDGLVNFWEIEGDEMTHGGVLKGHELAVLCLVAKGRLVLSGSADKNICVWRREEGAEHVWMMVLTGHTGPVKCLEVEEDGEKGKWKVYSGSLDKSVKIWSVLEMATEDGDSASESFRSERSDQVLTD